MHADLYIEILRQALLPFIEDKFPEGHKFMQDNDPKHTSSKAKQFMIENGIKFWLTINNWYCQYVMYKHY